MKLRIGIAGVLLLLLAASGLHAQEPAPPPVSDSAQEPPDPQLKPNPLDALRSFEPAADEEYRLGRGDEIIVDFSGRPEMQAKLVVGPDGRISLPLIGDIMLAELTRSEAAKAIEAKLADYYSNMAVMVAVTKYTSNKILLLGAVERPGVLAFEGTPTLLEALTRGGLVTGASKIGQIPERCAIYRGHDQVIWVQLKELIESGNTLADLRLRRDDVVFVPSMAEHFVSVLGEVNRPGAEPLTSISTLATILSAAGGFTDKAGNMPHIQIVDPANGSTRNVSFKDVLNPIRSSEISLKPGEIVFVPRSGFYKATYILERLNPVTTVMTMAMLTGAL
jgi:polysaccharide export outer membrane protein